MTDFTRKNCNCSIVVGVSCIYNFSKFLHHFLIVLLLPSLVGLVDSFLHLVERRLEHCREVRVHGVDVVLKLGQLIVLFFLLGLLFDFYSLVLLLEPFNFRTVAFFLLLKSRKLLCELLLSGLVLSSHVSNNIVRAFLIHLNHLFLLLLSSSLLLLLSLGPISLLDHHDHLVFERFLFSLENIVLLFCGGVIGDASLLFSLLLSLLSFLLTAHILLNSNIKSKPIYNL